MSASAALAAASSVLHVLKQTQRTSAIGQLIVQELENIINRQADNRASERASPDTAERRLGVHSAPKYGATNPAQMQLQMQNLSGNSAVIGIVGGPQDASGNNGYVIGLNFGATAGPGTTNPSGTPQQGYYATTGGNSYTFLFNGNGGNIFVGNLSSPQATGVTLTLRSI